MSRLNENEDTVPLDDRLIDRLVDGALSESERRAVLSRLEGEPEAWRRCALAFLEAQAWREALGPVAAQVAPQRRLPAPSEVKRRPRCLHRAPAAIAGGLLAAFALGWAARGVPLAGVLNVSHTNAGRPSVVLAPSAPASTEVPDRVRPLPVVARIPRVPSESPLVSESVARAWESRGYQVERSQRLVSMELKNGRRVAVPIDEVRLRFVGDRTY
jgi:anti-sigma factor RsiW